MTTPAMLTPFDPRRGNAVLAAALAEWKSIVREPPAGSPDRIREYLRACGFSRPDDYDANGDAEWCGAFAAFCLISSGVRPELLRQKSPPEAGGLGSTYRLHRLCILDERRRITRPEDVRAGDVVVVGRIGRSSWGEHITIAEATHPERSYITTVEGNAVGQLGNLSQGEGVIRRTRPFAPTANAKGFVFGFRPVSGDYIGEVHHG